MRIDVLVFDGFDELDALAPFEVLQNAAAAGADFQVRLVGWTGGPEVVAAHGLRLHVAAGEDTVRPDIVVVPGGGWISEESRGARCEVERGVVPRRLAELHAAGMIVASVCTGAMLVAAAGILKGRPATTHQGAIDELRAAGAEIIDARVVDDGDVVSAGGVTSGLDLALWIVERFAGREVMLAVEREMEYERRGEVWRRDGSA